MRGGLALAFVLALRPAAGRGSAPVALDPGDLAALVRERNPGVAAARADREGAEALAGFLPRSFLPRLEATGGAESWRGPGVGSGLEPRADADLSVNVYRGGRDALEAAARDAGVEIARADEEAAWRTALADARTAYWELVATRERIGLLDHAKSGVAGLMEGAARRVTAGLTTRVDADMFTLFADDLAERIARERDAEAATAARLALWLGLEPAAGVSLTRTAVHAVGDNLAAAEPAGLHPEVRRLRASGAAWEARARLRGRWWTPAVDLYGRGGQFITPDRGFADAADRSELGAGVRLTLALEPGDSLREAAAGRSFAEADRRRADEVQRRTDAALRIARARVAGLTAAVESSRDLADRAGGILTRVREEYDRGVRTASDLLAAQERALAMRERFLDRRLALALAEVELAGCLGR